MAGEVAQSGGPFPGCQLRPVILRPGVMKKSSLLFLLAVLPLQAQVKIEDPAAEALVAADAKIEKLAGDLKFTEGPVWIAEKKALCDRK